MPLYIVQSTIYNDVMVIPLEYRGSYSATSDNMKLVHWPQPTQAPHHCSKCNIPPIDGQCTNHRMAV